MPEGDTHFTAYPILSHIRIVNKILVFIGRTVVVLLALLLLIVLLIQTELVQNYAVQKAARFLSREWKTEVSIQKISVGFFDKVNAEGILIRDQQKDTLLYAGLLKVRLTDWFFLNNKLELTYVGLENAVIHQQRSKDSLWNHYFITDYFRSSSSKKSSKTIVLDLKKIDFKNVFYRKTDAWKGENMYVRMASLVLEAEKIDLKSLTFRVRNIELVRPIFELTNYKGFRPDSLKPKNNTLPGSYYFNAADMDLWVGNISITNGVFASTAIRAGQMVNRHFDGSHIRITSMEGHLQQLRFARDTIRMSVDLSGKERSGFELKKLKTDFRLTPQIMEFANLDLRSSKSRLGNYYAMKFDDFQADFPKYVTKVVMDARFRESIVHSDDVAYFAPQLKTWNKYVDINGLFLGTVDNFRIQNMVLRNGTSTVIGGELSMKGLPEVSTTLIGFNGNVVTNSRDLAIFLPPVKRITNPDINALGLMRFTGMFRGTLSDFSTRGTLSSSLGAIYANARLVLPSRGEPSYSGELVTTSFNLGRFIKESSIGRVSFKGNVKGSSFDVLKLNSTLAGTFSSFEFNGYNYKNLSFDGRIQLKNFIGDFVSNDPNFNFTSNVAVDFSGPVPKINLVGDLVYSNLQKLNFINRNLQFTGLIDLNFEGKNIDEFLGSVKVLNAALLVDSIKLSFDSLYVNSYFDSLYQRNLNIESNEFLVHVRGEYNLLDLPNSFQYFLNRYYPNVIAPPARIPRNQRFDVQIQTRNFSDYLSAVDGRMSGLDSATIDGSILLQDSASFFVTAQIPSFKYQQYRLAEADIEAQGDDQILEIEGALGRVVLGDSMYLPESRFSVQSKNDVSVISLTTRANKILNDANLKLELNTLEDGVRIRFEPSSFVLNDKKWNLEKEGEVIVRRNFASASNVLFTQGTQQISIESVEEDGGNQSNLVIRLKEVSLGDFLPVFVPEPRMEGAVTGNVYLYNFFGNFRAEGKLNAEQFRLGPDSVGQVLVEASYASGDNMLRYKASSPSALFKFKGEGTYNLGKDTTAKGPMAVNLQLDNTSIGILNTFLGTLFENIKGQASGNLQILGSPARPQLLGKVRLKDASLLVKYTQVKYLLPEGELNFTPDYLDFGTLTLQDEAGRTGTLSGRLYQKAFENFAYNLSISTDGMLLLNTRPQDNSLFYGSAVGRANMYITGDESDMRMSISGEVTDRSIISVRTDAGSKSSEVDFIVFKQYGTEIKENALPGSNLSIDLDLKTNNLAQINVILDEATGDVIEAVGNGRMFIRIPAVGNVTMNGRYNIERGNYNFNFQSFIRKPFVLKEDAGNYIEWKGSPYEAAMKVDAQFTADNVSLNDLFSNNNIQLGGTVRAYRGQVYVIASLVGKLTNPDINFRLEFPPNTDLKYDDTFNRFLVRLQSDNNELLKQVTWLIVFGSFAPYGESLGSSASNGVRFNSIGINTISQKLTAELSKAVSNLIAKITGDKSIKFELGTSTYSSTNFFGGVNTPGSNRLDRQQVKYVISRSFGKGNIIVTAGGNLDFGWGGASALAGTTSAIQFLPDVSIQIILNKNRTLRAVIFNKSSLDVSTGSVLGRRTRQGVSLSYSRNFRRIFGGKKEGEAEAPGGTSLPSSPSMIAPVTDTSRRLRSGPVVN